MWFKTNLRILAKCLVFVMTLAFIIPQGTLSHAVVVDKVIIVVNDEVVTQREFDRAHAQMRNEFEKRFRGEDLNKRLEAAPEIVKEQLINSKLAISLAKKKKLKIDKDELNERIDKIKAYYPTEEVFLQALNERGTNLTELEREIEDEMLAQ
ncbi:hypothetical protein GOV10_04360, partial [Candidatus Woesearchaeota archaeon]|nr:hypothetical protein [Candidatus Woesearchaeota archaeon]